MRVQNAEKSSTVTKQAALESAIIGSLLGLAIGDAVGLPGEGLTRRRLQKLYPKLSGPRLLFGKGMVSDDTEHACMTAQALIASAGDVPQFTRALARQLRGWLLCIPAGIGLATLRATLKLCLGVSGDRSGVFSAGNGPAMRSPLLGVCCGHDLERLRGLVRASTRITHTDPKAEYGALAVALAAYTACTFPEATPTAFCRLLRETLEPEAEALLKLVEHAAASAQLTTVEFANEIGMTNGVSGYIYHTVPVVLHAWFRYPKDVRTAIQEIIACGGDTDTTGAILGGIVGAGVGAENLPTNWLTDLWEWPRTVVWIRQLGATTAQVMSQGAPQRTLPLSTAGILARNVLFLSVVLLHGFRRLLPPY